VRQQVKPLAQNVDLVEVEQKEEHAIGQPMAPRLQPLVHDLAGIEG
jgi:hypothetical protein